MKHSDFQEIVDSTFKTLQDILQSKGGEYAGDHDRLANFKRNAERLHLRPEQIWAVYFAKHIDAIFQYIMDLQTQTNRPRSEPLEGRVDDAINYLLLFKGILAESRQQARQAERDYVAKELRVDTTVHPNKVY